MMVWINWFSLPVNHMMVWIPDTTEMTSGVCIPVSGTVSDMALWKKS